MFHGITRLKKSTYTNYTLNHISCNDHILTIQNIFDCILSNYIINEPCNPSSHNVIPMSISITEYNHVTHKKKCAYEQGNKSTIKWYKADKVHISNYENVWIICYLMI